MSRERKRSRCKHEPGRHPIARRPSCALLEAHRASERNRDAGLSRPMPSQPRGTHLIAAKFGVDSDIIYRGRISHQKIWHWATDRT